jgi:hypothetical protein
MPRPVREEVQRQVAQIEGVLALLTHHMERLGDSA